MCQMQKPEEIPGGDDTLGRSQFAAGLEAAAQAAGAVQTNCPCRKPSAGKGRHARGRSARRIGRTV